MHHGRHWHRELQGSKSTGLIWHLLEKRDLAIRFFIQDHC
jgi:hypothetical protein